MTDPFLAEIRIFPFNFAPRGWALCDGQLLPIAQNTALFSLIGTVYGGDGRSTFALPDLQGASPLGVGQGPGLSQRSLGETGGSETVTLLASQMPLHTHSVAASASEAGSRVPAGELPANAVGLAAYGVPGSPAMLAAAAVGTVGSGQPHNNLPPYLTLQFCIALQGVYPPRP